MRIEQRAAGRSPGGRRSSGSIAARSRNSARALGNINQYDNPTPEQMLAITRQLRTEGDMSARRLAEQIEQATRAHL
jgi:hypothetical protein